MAVKRLGKRNAVKRVDATPDSKTESNPKPENDSDKNNPTLKAE